MRCLFLALLCAPLVALGQGRASSDTCTPGGLLYCSASGTYGASSAGSSTQCLISNGSGAPTWGACTSAVLNTQVVDAGAIALTATSALPTNVSSDQLTISAFQWDGGVGPIPVSVAGAAGVPMPLGTMSGIPSLPGGIMWRSECHYPTTWNQNTLVAVGAGASSNSGTAGNIAWASTNIVTRARSVSFASNATTNANAGPQAGSSTIINAWRGDGAGKGGFYYWTRVELRSTKATARGLFGLTNLQSGIVADPSTMLDTVYIGFDGTDANLQACSNDNVGSATCATLGANFPANTNNATYDIKIWAEPGASSIAWQVERLDSAQVAYGVITSDLPRNSVQLMWRSQMNTGSNNGTAVTLGFQGLCVVSNI